MINDIKALLGISDSSKDNLIQVLIDRCVGEYKDFTHQEDISTVEQLICSMVVYQFSRLGTEGVSSESLSGATFHYDTDYPQSILRQLKSHRRLITR